MSSSNTIFLFIFYLISSHDFKLIIFIHNQNFKNLKFEEKKIDYKNFYWIFRFILISLILSMKKKLKTSLIITDE